MVAVGTEGQDYAQEAVLYRLMARLGTTLSGRPATLARLWLASFTQAANFVITRT
jgi:hypothetical protein